MLDLESIFEKYKNSNEIYFKNELDFLKEFEGKSKEEHKKLAGVSGSMILADGQFKLYSTYDVKEVLGINSIIPRNQDFLLSDFNNFHTINIIPYHHLENSYKNIFYSLKSDYVCLKDLSLLLTNRGDLLLMGFNGIKEDENKKIPYYNAFEEFENEKYNIETPRFMDEDEISYLYKKYSGVIFK